MTIDHAAARARIEDEERSLVDVPLAGAALFALGQDLLARAPQPIVVKIAVGGRVLFQAAQDGTAAENDLFVDLKLATVRSCGHSSLWWHHHLRAGGRTLADMAWADPRHLMDFGGAVPLRAGGQLVGAVSISGLPHVDDHGLVVAAMRGIAR